VVYNHTYNDEMFANITSQYYTGNNDSGTGNGVDTGQPRVSRMIQDSLDIWLDHYNIDGFRFDLMGIFHYQEVNNWGEYLNTKYADRNILLYGEPWNGYWGDPNESQKVRMGNVPAMASGHIGVFNGKFRESIKGDNDGTGRGYMFNFNANALAWDMQVGSRGGILFSKSTSTLPNIWDPMFAYDPEQSINYISAHDNYCLWDKVKHVGEDNDYGKRVVRFGDGIVFTSQGIPFIHAGDEMLRTKVVNGDWTYSHNSYNAPDDYNKIRWNWKEENLDVYNYHKDLIALRNAHPGFRLNSWDEINTNMTTYRDGSVVVSQINADANGDTADEIIVVYNSGNNYNVSLPAGSWTKVFDINGSVNVAGLSGSAIAEGTAVTVFVK
jgi:pullulanase